MASETPTPPREALEQQDQSIKARKHQLFEDVDSVRQLEKFLFGAVARVRAKTVS